LHVDSHRFSEALWHPWVHYKYWWMEVRAGKSLATA